MHSTPGRCQNNRETRSNKFRDVVHRFCKLDVIASQLISDNWHDHRRNSCPQMNSPRGARNPRQGRSRAFITCKDFVVSVYLHQAEAIAGQKAGAVPNARPSHNRDPTQVSFA